MKSILSFIRRVVLCLAVVCGVSSISAQAGYLYVLNQQNAAPNQIYCFVVNETTGSLVPVAGFPVATGGNGVSGTQSELLTIDRVNNRLYVINKGSNTVSAFNISTATGALTPMFSPFTVVTNANTIAVHPTGSPVVIGGNTGTPFSGPYLADSYNVTATSATQAAGSPYNTGGSRPASSAFSRDGNYYYTGGGLSLIFAGFGVNAANGILTALPGSPYGGFGVTGIRAYATDTQGRLFTAASGDGGLRVFTTASGVPTQTSAGTFASGLATLVDGVLSPNEQFYLIADSSTSQVAAYRISGAGAATTLSSTGLAGSFGSTLNTIVFNQAGTYLFAAHASSRSVGRFNFNQTSGAITHVGTSPNNSVGTSGFLAGLDYLPTAPPTAAGASITGRVVTDTGTMVSRAIIILTDANGNSRSAVTNSFGYYRFENVSVGQTYTLTVESKRYQFDSSTKVISLQDNLTDVDFIAF